MNVFVVIETKESWSECNSYGDPAKKYDEVVGVCSTEDNAQALVDQLKEKQSAFPVEDRSEFYFDEFTLDGELL
ncbi:hypothetical protein GNAINCEL_00008 [Serratia phage KKP 3709]|nr:hypothetical protein GNAINCEL_00008 [Serratia phage KKP 3709]